MNTIYTTKVNDSLELKVSEDASNSLDAVMISDNMYHILHKNKSYKAEVVKRDFNSKTYQVKVNNTMFSVTIANHLDQLIKDMGFEVGATKHVNDIKAPMPGLILDINVTVGQEVKENDNLLILEAMKMENVLTSPRDGIIKSISVSKGEAVDKSQLLIEFE